VHLEWDCGRTLGKGGTLFLGLLCLRWGMTKFWHDLWCGNTVLKVVFPILFGIACVKDASIVNNMEILGGST
jgi:hypothetical protein